MSQELVHLPLHLDLLCGMADRYHKELEDMEVMAFSALKAADVTKVRWSWGTLGPSSTLYSAQTAPRPRAGESSCNKEQKRLSWACPPAPRCLHSSSSILLLGQAVLGLGTACPKQVKAACSILQPSLPSFLPSLFTWWGAISAAGHPRSSAGSRRSIPASAAASPFSDVLQEEMAKMETRFRAERELRYRSLAAQNVTIDRLWLKEANERHLRAVSWGGPAQAGVRADGGHQCQAPRGLGGDQLPQGVSGSRGDDERPCSKPGTSSPWTSRACTSRSSRRVSAGGRWDTGAAAGTLRCRFPPTLGAKLEATKSQMEREAWVTEKMEKAKAAVQCSRLWVT